MGRSRLSPRPRAPLLVAAAMAGTLACGSDDGGSSSSDVHPTAGPCAHDPNAPGCEGTGVTTDSTSLTDTDSGTSTGTSAGNTSSDSFPTTPCAHDPDLPECGSTGSTDGTGSSGDTSTGTAGSSGSSGG